MRRSFENGLEKLLFGSRWLLAPLYLGLIAGMCIIVAEFCARFWEILKGFGNWDPHAVILEVLGLLDLTLLANLILIVVFSGYENFVSKIRVAEGSEDKPHWMGRVDYSGLKIKLIGSLVAISVIELLKDFLNPASLNEAHLFWRIVLHFTFVLSGVLFALMDLIAEKRVLADLVTDEDLQERRKTHHLPAMPEQIFGADV
jgi:uncharacterized protein (TIGR00645 family)